MTRLGKFLLALAALGCLTAALVAPADAGKRKMRSTKVNKHLCQTTGGGAFVPIPDFPGEQIDRRLLTDIKWMEKRWDIFVTDAYSRDGVHAANGEHPIGLAADIVPNKTAGGTWKEIDRLAAWAEPVQNQPRAPFRWVGYDGDAGHGRRNHLHLSWSHSTTRPFHPAATVYTVNCPKARIGGGRDGGGGGGNGGSGGDGDGGGKGDGGKGGHHHGHGGIGTGGGGGGGIGARVASDIALRQNSNSSIETGGEGFGG